MEASPTLANSWRRKRNLEPSLSPDNSDLSIKAPQNKCAACGCLIIQVIDPAPPKSPLKTCKKLAVSCPNVAGLGSPVSVRNTTSCHCFVDPGGCARIKSGSKGEGVGMPPLPVAAVVEKKPPRLLKKSNSLPADYKLFKKDVVKTEQTIAEELNINLKLDLVKNCEFEGEDDVFMKTVPPTPVERFVSVAVDTASLGSNKMVSPTEFRRKRDLMKKWFFEFDDDQKNLMIKALLCECGPSQNHVISMEVGSRLHEHCPPNCQDLVSSLPKELSLNILQYLDPVSLSRTSQVCRSWWHLSSNAILWRRLCKRPQWCMTSVAERRQIGRHSSSDDGTVDWQSSFVERYRLQRNWLKSNCHIRTFEGHSQGISCVQFDETRIVSGSSDKCIKVWNIRTNSPWSVMTLVGHSGTVRCLHLQGNRLVSGSTDSTIKVWDLDSQPRWTSINCKVTMIGHTDTVRCLQADEDKVVSGSYDKTLKVWDSRTGLCKLTLRGHEAAVLCLQFDDRKIVSGSCDRTVKIWSLETGQCMTSLRGHWDAVTCLQFDEQRLITGSLDRTIKFWCLTSNQCISTLDWMKSEGHTGVIRCLQADRWRMVSAGDDKTLKVWSLDTGRRLVTLRNHTDGVTCLQFNDYCLVSGSYDKTVKLWDFSVC